MQSSWYRAEINLLIESLKYYWRGCTDFYAGGNMFICYCIEQTRTRNYRGPDFFVVVGVDGTRMRKAWVVWEEGRYPGVIIELLSPTTAQADKTVKKQLYEQTFRMPEYFLLRSWHAGATRLAAAGGALYIAGTGAAGMALERAPAALAGVLGRRVLGRTRCLAAVL